MERVLEMIRRCVQLAWWDGSCIDLRLHRLPVLIDHIAAEPVEVRVRREAPYDRA